MKILWIPLFLSKNMMDRYPEWENFEERKKMYLSTNSYVEYYDLIAVRYNKKILYFIYSAGYYNSKEDGGKYFPLKNIYPCTIISKSKS